MENFLWWRDGVIYQIYPRSFADSNGDGIGDLNGITSKLDYLADLGVDAIWLSPFYPTPDKDFGYDISNYVDVDPRFGTLADFDRLAAEAHRRDIRVVLDMVLNHTSDQHPWFLESKSSRDNPKRDWYIWRDQPNNWQAVFGGNAWQWSPERGQFYYHMFLPEQPDLNWRNPDTRQAILDILRFWLARGADGFRFDVFNVYFKDAQFRDNPLQFGLRPFDMQQHIHDCDQPEMTSLLQEMRGLFDSYPERYAVGETFIATPEKAASYCGPDKFHAAFNFHFTERSFNPTQLLDAILRWEKATGTQSWPNYVLGNHDVTRPATRFSEGFLNFGQVGFGPFSSAQQKEEDARVKLMMILLLTLRGTPFLYYGDEIGMRELNLKREEIMDPIGKRYWPLAKGRDGCRTPMQWDDSPHAGFSSATPWLRVHPNHTTRNVIAQQADPDSLLNLTRGLLRLRKQRPALVRGDFAPVTHQPRGGLVYRRELAGQPTILVALNFSKRLLTVETPGRWIPLIGLKQAEARERLELPAYGFCVLEESA
jgi:alpha-glucosidase